jgi:hypothetical protein
LDFIPATVTVTPILINFSDFYHSQKELKVSTGAGVEALWPPTIWAMVAISNKEVAVESISTPDLM